MNKYKTQVIYLLSSNASKEYILDALEVLSLPFGMVQHFRYQLKWLDKNLKTQLPLKEDTRERNLKRYKVVICYLCQKKEKNNSWKWIEIYPIRTATLVDAYKTGRSNEDIAHFYFKVDKYIRYKNIVNLVAEMKKWSSWDKFYAFFGKNINNHILVTERESYSSFIEICESFKKGHFKDCTENVEYYPLFCFIDGLKTDKDRLSFKYDPLSHKSYYEISEGSIYSFEFRTYFPEKPPGFLITLRSDKKLFSTPSKYEFKISSRYSDESCMLIPRLLERDIFSIISFETQLEKKNIDKNKEPLSLNINFQIKVTRKLRYRVIDALSDIGFGIGTGAIALKAASVSSPNIPYILRLFSSWWTIVGAYALWIICKFIIKLWRG